MRIGINGFGRIGRAIFRINDLQESCEIVVINDTNPDNKNLAYLAQYDTTYGRFHSDISADEDSINYDNKKIAVHHQENILDVPWDQYDVDIVIDSSGIAQNLKNIKSIKNTKVKHFIVTNAAGDGVKTIIFGVNENDLDIQKDKIISSSICDTIALAPLINIINETHDINGGFLTTLHPYLGFQNLLDGPSVSWSVPGDVDSHYALGRSAINNLMPKATSAVFAADHVFPGLSNKLQSFSYRVPTSIVSSAVLILNLENDIDTNFLKKQFVNFEANQKIKILKNSNKPLVSMDYAKEDFSVIVDHRWTKVEGGKLLKIVYWYDNEWGYSNRVVDILKLLSSKYS
jgi:glyceraldehyde 3-phosphate dehydrogenase